MPASSFLDKLYALLAPSFQTCLGCGNRTRQSSAEIPDLCLACAKGIPWIRVPRCPICGRGIGCPDCTRGDWAEHRAFLLNRSAVMYNERMREWLGQYKYRGRENLAFVLGEMMSRAYKLLEQEMRTSLQDQSWQVDVVTCVPVSPSRLQERGFNQAEVLAEAAAGAAGCAYLPLLQRSRDTEKQSLKSRAERLQDMKKAFIPIPEAANLLSQAFKAGRKSSSILTSGKHQNKRITHPLRLLLVDDIYTTGSTIGACAGQLQEIAYSMGIKAEVYSLTWARS